MRRREFITVLGGAAAWPLAAGAQQPNRIRLVGVLMGYAESDPAVQSWLVAFKSALAKLGWTQGSNLRIELRWGAGDPGQIVTSAKEIVDRRPDAILGVSTPVIDAVVRETRTIPIVFAAVTDPIGSGFATSLAHPGGNVTGFTFAEPVMGGKWMELLKEMAPQTVRIALLFNPATAPPPQFYLPFMNAAASSLAVQTSAAPVHSKGEIEGVMAGLAHDPGGGIIVMPDAFNTANREMIIALAARYRAPAIYFYRLFAEAGGLVSYGPDFAEQFRLAAGYVDRILKGAAPADLPIQQPTKFEFVINERTAKMLGLDIPLHLQQLADEVIE